MQSLDYVMDLVNDFFQLYRKSCARKRYLDYWRTHGVYAEETFLGNIFGKWHL